MLEITIEIVVHEIDTAGVVYVSARAGFKQRLGVGGGKGRRRQIGTAQAGAIDRVMNSVVAVDRSQDAMFDVVQGQVQPGDLGPQVTPRDRGVSDLRARGC